MTVKIRRRAKAGHYRYVCNAHASAQKLQRDLDAEIIEKLNRSDAVFFPEFLDEPTPAESALSRKVVYCQRLGKRLLVREPLQEQRVPKRRLGDISRFYHGTQYVPGFFIANDRREAFRQTL